MVECELVVVLVVEHVPGRVVSTLPSPVRSVAPDGEPPLPVETVAPKIQRRMTTDGSSPDTTPKRGSSAGGLPSAALTYLTAVTVLACAVSWVALAGREPLDWQGWLAFALIAVGAAVAQLFPVVTPRNQSYHTTMVVLVPAALLLPAWLLPAVVVAQHLPEWLKVRYPWYIQLFNASNYLVDLFAAGAVAQYLLRLDGQIRNDELRFAVAGVAAAVVLVLLNHLLLSVMLRLARGHSLRESGLFSFESLTTDLVLAALGVLVAFAWEIGPALIPLAVAPLFLIQRSLAVPQLQEEARLDPKTGLLNVRYFSEIFNDRLEQALRTEQSLALLMIDLDLLREINNTHGHLAGDAVLERIAEVFGRDLRSDDIAARFGGEEFVLLLPDTDLERAIALAERVREAIARESIRVEAIDATLSATVSIGVAMCPRDGKDASTLIHCADLAVYRAKIQGRNRVVDGEAEPLAHLLPNTVRNAPIPVAVRSRLTEPPPEDRRTAAHSPPATPRDDVQEPVTGRQRRHVAFWAMTTLGIGLTALGAVVTLLEPPGDIVALATLAALVVGGQAFALRAESGSISVGAVGAIAGVALLGGSASVILALAAVVTDAVLRRPPVYTSIYNLGVLTAAGLGAAFVLSFGPGPVPVFAAVVYGAAAGGMYFIVNTCLLSIAIAAEESRPRVKVWRQGYEWLLPHYLAYGCVGAVVAIAYAEVQVYALAVFLVPLLLLRATQEGQLRASRESSERLREASETIHRQNVSLEEANRLLRFRSTEALDGLCATVDARDAYTAGHSRRVREIASRIGHELGLSDGELEMLGHAALFHDIGKIAVPDSVLMKPGSLSGSERSVMQIHAEEGAEIVSRLGFLADAVPAIRHHHEDFDGSGYPVGLVGVEIPLGARIIRVADALDAMMNERVYRPGRSLEEALAELRRGSGAEFCPRCVDAAIAVADRDASVSVVLAAVG